MTSDTPPANNKPVTPGSLKETVTNELERLETTNKWVWALFFLCFSPNILNGFHVSSYVLLAHISNDMWCTIPQLKDSNWTTEEMRNISSTGLTSKGCTVLDWDYSQLGHMTFTEAWEHTQTNGRPKEVSCQSSSIGGSYEFENPLSSIVPEWNLVCEKAVSRTSAQVSVSIGKFLGASIFGIMSDKFGRKTTFVLASAVYIISSIITTVSPWYTLFLAGRFGLGASASGIFYPAFALLSENIGVGHRSRMSIAFSASYPVGMLFLALVGYLIEPWRYLQLALTIPGFLLILNCYLMFESPRWLLSKDRVADAYRVVFKKKANLQLDNIPSEKQKEAESQKPATLSTKLLGSVNELKNLYGESKMRRMAFTCYFMWCVVSLCYYVTALNANNLAANRFVYVLITGCVDLPCYLLPMILLRFMGRKTAAFTLFTLAGISLLIVLAIPQENVSLLVFFAMFGRFGISAVYSIVTLHTAELFPTEIRNSALGTCSTMAHIGSITAPYIVDVLGLLGWFIPTTICGCSILVAGLLMLTLPETGKRNLVDHVKDEVECKNDKQ
ncbi:unnamed protein product [Hermetia illucens]|uniref:Major facilitator superfamily (MFS) profile domain-containing protein n=1 Tax=Hermetia illucens TaxID=343691 RepID=A0A7R8YT06_HERIL|nr:organic cation transporter protein [Hermetia illucens]CAD7084049.1 unnamed protein product [Hermetia illucens]